MIVGLAAVLPDLDAIGRPFGGGDVMWLGGHRAITHSLTFAAGFGALLLVGMRGSVQSVPGRIRLWLALSLAIASHGGLDALTMYGEGIEFLAPWSSARYWAPWRVLGGGIIRDTIAFFVLYGVARTVMSRRGFSLPRFLALGIQRAAV
jgi:membrane-bound metal-dependent hydrolase YbcI (DUF457 family)